MSDAIVARTVFETLIHDESELSWPEERRILLEHDAAQRAIIAGLEERLAALQHIGTGAGLDAKRGRA